MKMAGGAPLTLMVASVGHAAATVPVVVVVPGGNVGLVAVDVGAAGVVAVGLVEVGLAVGIAVTPLFAPPAVVPPPWGVVVPPPAGGLPVSVPTV
jgi:hypothetical protein